MGNCADIDDIENLDLFDETEHQIQKYQLIFHHGAGNYQHWRKPIEPIRNLTAREYFQELIQTIKRCSALNSILNQSYFLRLICDTDVSSRAQDKRIFAQILEEYVQFCSKQLQDLTPNENTDEVMKNYAEQFNYRFYDAINKAKVNKAVQTSISKYFSKFVKDFTFNFEESQTTKLCDDIKSLSSINSIGICYFSQYLVLCCENWQKKGKSVDEIIQKLRTVAGKLKDKFGVLNTRKQLGNALGNNDQFFPNSNLMSKFESIKKLKYQPVKISFDTSNREEQIEKQIMKFVDFGIKNLPFFNSIVQKACIQSEGFDFKSNLKLTSRKNKPSLMRVKQKLVSAFMKDAKPIKGCSSIQKLIKKDDTNFKELMEQAYQKMSELPFSVSDLLRGKCLFNKKQHIYKAAQKIINRVEQQARKGHSVAIVEVDDRFGGICQDLVFKIRIDDLVCEFQMALYFLQVQNTIHHKMYELVRSKFLSPIYLLYNWNQKATFDFFTGLQKQNITQMQKIVDGMKKKQEQDQTQDSIVQILYNQKTFNKKWVGKQQSVFVNRIPQFLGGNKINVQKLNKMKSKVDQRVKNIRKKTQQYSQQQKIPASFNKQGDLTTQLNTLNANLAIAESKYGKSSIEAAKILTSIGTIYNLFKKYQIAHIFLSKAEPICQGNDPKCKLHAITKYQNGKSRYELKKYKEAVNDYLMPAFSLLIMLDSVNMIKIDVLSLLIKCFYFLNQKTVLINSYSQQYLKNLKNQVTNSNKNQIADKIKQMSNFLISVKDNARAQLYLKESCEITSKTYPK